MATTVHARDPRGRNVEVHGRDPRGRSVTVHSRASGNSPLNVLLFQLDDVGLEAFSLYSSLNWWDGSFPYASMPTLAGLAAAGMRFDNHYIAGTSTQARAGILTGLRMVKARIGRIIDEISPSLDPSNPWTIASVPFKPWSELAGTDPGYAGPIRTWFLGKWHVHEGTGALKSPRQNGGALGYFGWVSNINRPLTMLGGNRLYRRFEVSDINPGTGAVTTFQYQPADGKHLAVETHLIARSWLQSRSSNEPWVFLVNSPLVHFPVDVGDYWIEPSLWPAPDGGHLGAGDGGYHSMGAETGSEEWFEKINMALESADTMLAEMIAAIPPAVLARTVIIFCTDNGSTWQYFDPAFSPSMATYNASGRYQWAPTDVTVNKVKPSVFDPHHRCPLLIWGGADTGIVPGVSTALVESCDIYATVADALGRAASMPSWVDGRSLLPIARGLTTTHRVYQEGSGFLPNGARPSEWIAGAHCLKRADGWKLHTYVNVAGMPAEMLFDVASDPQEDTDLMSDVGVNPTTTAAYNDLVAERDRIFAAAETFDVDNPEES